MSIGQAVRRLVIAVVGSGLILGCGTAYASVGDGSRAPVGDAWSGRAPNRSALRARYPSIPPPPPVKPPAKPPAKPPVKLPAKPPVKPPTLVVPAICRQRAAIVCASKKERTLRYFERGSLWLSTPVAFGRRGYETPSGLWTVRIKDANAWSYEFKAPLPFSLEYDLARGIYIHYSSTFRRIGPSYIGSHGCINIGNYATARTLFLRVPTGAAVYVY